MNSKIKTVCIYCGSSNSVDKSYFELAKLTGEALANTGRSLVYGGGHVGLMGTVADAVMGNGGEAIGIIPHHLFLREKQHENLTKLIIVDNMHERKAKMVEMSDAFLILPGGFGTMDEAFEIITWKQLGLHDKQIIIMNFNGYWDAFVELVKSIVEHGFGKEEHFGLFQIIKDPSELEDAFKSAAPQSFAADMSTL